MDAFRSNHAEDFILERTDMPDELIRNVEGEMVFQEERPLVCVYIVNVCITYFICAYRVGAVNLDHSFSWLELQKN